MGRSASLNQPALPFAGTANRVATSSAIQGLATRRNRTPAPTSSAQTERGGRRPAPDRPAAASGARIGSLTGRQLHAPRFRNRLSSELFEPAKHLALDVVRGMAQLKAPRLWPIAEREIEHRHEL
jgi:hypothetical protein